MLTEAMLRRVLDMTLGAIEAAARPLARRWSDDSQLALRQLDRIADSLSSVEDVAIGAYGLYERAIIERGLLAIFAVEDASMQARQANSQADQDANERRLMEAISAEGAFKRAFPDLYVRALELNARTLAGSAAAGAPPTGSPF